MSVLTSSSYSTPLQRQRSTAEQSPLGPNSACLKTTNSQIFPSLHPMGNFYREKTKPVPKPAFQTPKTSLCDPVKKVKIDSNTAKVVEANQEKKSDEFRVPKLPSRFNKDNKKDVTVSEQKSAEQVQITEELSSVPSALVMPECILQDKRQSQTSGFTPRNRPVKNEIGSFRNQIPVRIPVAKRPVKPTINQQDVLLGMYLQALEARSVYDKIDFISSQLRQSVPHLFQICQDKQTKFSENVRIPYTNGKANDIQQEIHC